jgi:hypothetical protein
MSKKVEDFDLKKLQENNQAIISLKDEIANMEYSKALLINKLQAEVNSSDNLRSLMSEKYGAVSIDLSSGKISEITDGKPDAN